MTTWYESQTESPALQPQERAALEPRMSIYVPFDGSEPSLAAVPVARSLAALEGATLHIVHVAEDRVVPPRELVQKLGFSAEELPGVVVDELAGEPAESIVRLAHGVRRSLIVMAAHSEHLEAEGCCELGHVTQEVLSTAECPVVLVRPERGTAPWALQRLVLPHDGSPRTARALQPAIGLADAAGAEIFILHVATLMGKPTRPENITVPSYVDQPQHEWPEWAREFLERMEVYWELKSGVQPRLFLSKGDPGAEILHFAENRQIDLIGVAWHGSLATEHADTIKEIIFRSPCPVLFLRAEEDGSAELVRH